MLKPSITAIALVAFAFTATGCSMYQSGQSQTGQSAQCTKLKRELVHLSAHRNGSTWATAGASTQREELKRQLAAANCS
jgi:hypothetical protein